MEALHINCAALNGAKPTRDAYGNTCMSVALDLNRRQLADLAALILTEHLSAVEATQLLQQHFPQFLKEAV